MPEHVHLLILPAEQSKISRILHFIEKPTANRVIAWGLKDDPTFLLRMEQRRPSGKIIRRFWQPGGGYDRNVRSAREVHQKIRYLHANPVRRGLVENPGDWPWSSWRAWEYDVDEPVRIDRTSVPPLGH